MTIVYSASAIAAASETDEVILKKVSFTTAKIKASCFTDLTERGRNRGMKLLTTKSTATVKAKPFLAKFAKSKINAQTKSNCKYLSCIPTPIEPIGEALLEGKHLDGRRLVRGKSYALHFEIRGERLNWLNVRFAFFTLQDKRVLEKQVKIAPGGVLIEDLIEIGDNEKRVTGQVVTGVIYLLPQETFLLGVGKEVELKYSFEVGNGRDREYLLQSGFVTFDLR